MSDYLEFFYESKKMKKHVLKKYANFIKIKKRKKNGYKDFDLKKKIKNKDYIVFIADKEFTINFYDYNWRYLIFELLRVNEVPENEKNRFLVDALNKPQFWTLQNQIKINRLYNDNHLNFLFFNDVGKMLKHKVPEKFFNEVKMFKDFKFPFSKEGFIK